MHNFPNTNQYSDKRTEPMTVGGWLKTFLLMYIPFINIILIFVWAFGSNTNISKKNFFRASLLLSFILFIIIAGVTIAVCVLFQDQILDFNNQLNNTVNKLNTN